MRVLLAALAVLAALAGGLWWSGYFTGPVQAIKRYEDGVPRQLTTLYRRRGLFIPAERWGGKRPSLFAWYWVPEMVFFFPDGKPSEYGYCQPFPLTGRTLQADLPVDGVVREGIWTGLHPSGNVAFRVPYRNGVKEGPLLAWHDNGQMSERGDFREDQKSGTWTSWYPNGKKSEEMSFAAGRPHGKRQTWHEDGRPWAQQNYEQGVQVGIEIIEDDQRERAESHWVAGKENGLRKVVFRDRRVEQHVRDNQLHGEHHEYTAQDALLVRGQYENDRMQGRWITYYPDGTERWERHYALDRLHGPERRWRADGTLESEGSYVAGEKQGPWTEWNARGEKQVEGEWLAGKRHGTWTFYEKGQPARRTIYDRGKVIKTEELGGKPGM